MASRKRLDLKAKRSGARVHPPLAKRAIVEMVQDSDVVITSPPQQEFHRLRGVYSTVLAALSIKTSTPPLPKSTLSDHHHSPAEDCTSQPLPSVTRHWTALPPPNLSLLMRRPLLPLPTDTYELDGTATTERGRRAGVAVSPPQYQESPPLPPANRAVATDATKCFDQDVEEEEEEEEEEEDVEEEEEEEEDVEKEEEEEEEEEAWDKLCMEVDLTVYEEPELCSESPPSSPLPSSTPPQHNPFNTRSSPALEKQSASTSLVERMMTVGKSLKRGLCQKLSSFVSILQTSSHTPSSSMMSDHPPSSAHTQPLSRVDPQESTASNHVGDIMEEYLCPMCSINLPPGTTEQEFSAHLSACVVMDDDDVIIID